MELEKLTMKELGVKLVELGMPEEDVKGFRTKAPMISTINTMMAKDAAVEVKEPEEVKKVASIEERPNPTEERQVGRAWKTKAERMKNNLLGQEFVSIIVPLEPQEKMGEVEWVKSGKNEEVIPFKEWKALPLNEKMGTYQKHFGGSIITPQLNGFRYMIPKGTYASVPLQIFEVVNEANLDQMKAIQHKNLDRVDPQTGRPYKDSF